MLYVLLVGVGGALGAMARYGLQLLVPPPIGTFTVNAVGSLLMGLLVGFLALRGQPNEMLRLLLAVGVLGGFTTFSSFSLDVVQLVQRGAMGQAFLYATASVLLSVAALLVGLFIARIGA